ncbi:hypothetical protein [Acinetobacter defluvii]|uniref:hypothetical protein n=1 Tax=Acinetobacter defluvii TaxID=1871111 RepID=UPI003AF5F9A6
MNGISTEKFVIDQKLDYKIKRTRQMNNSHYKECMGLMLKRALTSIFLFLFKSALGLKGKEHHSMISHSKKYAMIGVIIA